MFTVFTMTDHRDRILATACELYLTDGLHGFSMRKLAKQVGVTAPAIYRHYDSREDLFADMLREAYRVHTRYIYRALSQPTPLERFFGAGEGYLDFVLEHPRWHSILNVGAEALGMESIPEDIEATGCAVHQFWIDRVRECMEAGILKRDDPATTAVTIWAHAHGMVQLYHQGHFRMSADEFRVFFEASGARLMAGVASGDFATELTDRYVKRTAELEV